jgi:hypothetical protein
MRRMMWLLTGAVALPLSVHAAEPTPTVGRVFSSQAKPGMTTQLEAGRKRHMDWHRKQNDSWAWFTWEVETGDRAGTYITGTFGHRWKDFDDWETKLGKGDTADGALNLTPFVGSTVNGFYELLPDVSRPSGSAEPAPLSELIHYQLNPGSAQEFRSAMKKVHEAIGKSSWNVNYAWYELSDGGDHPAYVLAFPMKGFADMESPDPSFPVMLEKAFGRYEAQEVMKSIDRSVKSMRSEIVRYRADLSYVPAPAK